MSGFTCTESITGPILDVVFLGLNTTAGVIMLSDPDEFGDSGYILGSTLVWGAILGASAVVGFNKTSKCRDALRDLAERQSGVGVQTPMATDSLHAWARPYPIEDRVRFAPSVDQR